MDFRLVIDPQGKEEVVVTAHSRTSLTDRIEELVLSGNPATEIPGYDPVEDEYAILNFKDIELFCSEEGKTFAVAGSGNRFLVKSTLRDLERILPAEFERISKSAIANWKKVKKLKVRITGSVFAVFESGVSEDISRRCFSDLKRRYSL